MSPHAFDTAIALAAQSEGLWQGHTSPAYSNMIGPFGGVTAAQALNAVLQHPQRLGEPVAFTVNFATALADGPFLVQARAARTNRSTQHWIVEIRQGDQTVLTATAVTAVRRDTWGAREVPMPEVPRAQDVPVREVGPAESNGPAAMRCALSPGCFPSPGTARRARTAALLIWVRDNPPRPLDFASLTALSDVFFPRIWLRRARFVPIGTVSMTVYFHAGLRRSCRPPARATCSRRRRLRPSTMVTSIRMAQLWNEAGELLVTTHQVVYYKE